MQRRTTREEIHRNPYMTKDMARIVLKLILLHRIKREGAYSYALIKELDNPRISKLLKKRSSAKNDIYNTVNILERSGYIKARSKIENGRLKKYYHITARGNDILKESKKLFMRTMRDLMGILG